MQVHTTRHRMLQQLRQRQIMRDALMQRVNALPLEVIALIGHLAFRQPQLVGGRTGGLTGPVRRHPYRRQGRWVRRVRGRTRRR